MRHERVLKDLSGQSVRVVMEIDDSGPLLEAAILRLANKARSSMRKNVRTAGRVTALDGAVRVMVTPVGGVTYRCTACGERLTYDVALPEHRLNHQREGSRTCEGQLELVREP